MTNFNNNNINQYKGLIPQSPRTETRIFLEVKEQSNLSKIGSYLGIKTSECSGKELTKDEQEKKLKEIEDRTEALAKGAKKSGAKGTFTYVEESGNKKTGDYNKKKVKHTTE